MYITNENYKSCFLVLKNNFKFQQFFAFFSVVLMMILVACAPVTKISDQQWQIRQRALQQINYLQANGSVIVTHHGERSPAYFAWQQCDQQYQLNVFGPLGAGNTQIRADKSRIILRTPQGQSFYAKNAEDLFAQQLGWPLPIYQFPYWLRGVNGQGKQARIRLDAHHRLAQLEQSEWTVQYLYYQRYQHLELPKRILLQNASHDLKVMVVVGNWQFKSCHLPPI